jgi:hypothetical protein
MSDSLSNPMLWQEYQAWLEIKAEELGTLDESLKDEIPDLTGRVPGYLNNFLKHLKQAETKGVPEALYKFALELGSRVAQEIAPFIERDLDNFLRAAAHLVMGTAPTQSGNSWDHSFFYVEDNRSYAVCGVASRTLMKMLVDHETFVALDTAFIASCINETNRWVQAFRAEEIVIRTICARELTLMSSPYSVPFGKAQPIYFTTWDTLHLTTAPGVYQVIPPPGFQHIDSLIYVLPRGKKPLVHMIPQQTTLQTVAEHKHTREFFAAKYKEWQDKFPLGFQFRWHLLWVLTQQKATMKNSRHVARDYKCLFTEHFWRFEDINPSLRL